MTETKKDSCPPAVEQAEDKKLTPIEKLEFNIIMSFLYLLVIAFFIWALIWAVKNWF